MSEYAVLILLAVVLAAMVAYSRRAKQRSASAEEARRQALHAGSEVMTTSGLYATVVSMNDDTALLSIAPGIEVKWAVAALRGVDELPDQYRRPIEDPAAGNGTAASDSAEPEPS